MTNYHAHPLLDQWFTTLKKHSEQFYVAILDGYELPDYTPDQEIQLVYQSSIFVNEYVIAAGYYKGCFIEKQNCAVLKCKPNKV